MATFEASGRCSFTSISKPKNPIELAVIKSRRNYGWRMKHLQIKCSSELIASLWCSLLLPNFKAGFEVCTASTHFASLPPNVTNLDCVPRSPASNCTFYTQHNNFMLKIMSDTTGIRTWMRQLRSNTSHVADINFICLVHKLAGVSGGEQRLGIEACFY